MILEDNIVAGFYVDKYDDNLLNDIRATVSNIITSNLFKIVLNDYQYTINTINIIDRECGIHLPINEILVFVNNKIDFVVFNKCYIKTDIMDKETILGCLNMYNLLSLNIKRPISPYSNSIIIEN